MTCKGVVVLNQPVVDVYNCEPSSYQNSSQSLVSCVCVSWDDSRNYIMLLENAHVFLSFSWYTFDGETEGETN